MISDSYDWLSDKENSDAAVQYVLGLNDMARYLADREEYLAEQVEIDEPNKNPRRKDLDMGKIKALHDAGWTIAKIADEMHTSSATISKMLKEVEEDG